MKTELSDRQQSIFVLIGQGRTTKEIAETLGIDVKTVDTHRETIKRKLSVDNMAKLTVLAARHVLLQELDRNASILREVGPEGVHPSTPTGTSGDGNDNT